MSTLTIRGIDDELKTQLRVRAAQHGRSMAAEVRAILHDALTAPAPSERLGSRIHQRFATSAGMDGSAGPSGPVPDQLASTGRRALDA